jgi:hypothetical protein
VHRSTRWSKNAVALAAGVLAALGVATGLTQAQTSTSTSTSTTTAPTTTTKTTPTTTTTTKQPAPKAKAKATTKTVNCKAALVAAKPPVSSAENFGNLTCSTPFGKGVQHDTSTVTRTSQTAGAFSGPVKLFFNTGTLRGSYKMSFTVANKNITYDGTMKISSGTGEFSGVTGTGTMTGTSDDAVHSAITEKLTLKIPPKKTG